MRATNAVVATREASLRAGDQAEGEHRLAGAAEFAGDTDRGTLEAIRAETGQAQCQLLPLARCDIHIAQHLWQPHAKGFGAVLGKTHGAES